MKNEDVYVAEISKFIFIIVSQTAAAHPAASCGACKAPPPSLIEFKQIHLLKSFLFLRCSLRLDVISDYIR